MSTASREKSVGSLVPFRRSSMSGFASRKVPKRGRSHLVASDGVERTISTERERNPRMRWVASAICSTPPEIISK